LIRWPPGPRFLFFAGKGGVGKTTCAAAAALAAAESGRDALVLSTDPAHSLGDAFGVRLGPRPRRLASRKGRLFAAELDAAGSFRAFMKRRRGALAAIVERGTYLEREDIERFVHLSLPGVDELMALIELARLAAAGRYDSVVVDTAPTGHTLRLLAMPALLERVASVLDHMLAKHRFLGQSLGGVYRPDETDALVRELDEEASALQSLVRDRARAAFRWVTLPERMSIEETKDALGALEDGGIHVGEIVVNRVTSPPPGSCGLCEGRRRAEAPILAELGRLAGRRPLRIVPALDREPRAGGLRAVARALAARGAAPRRRAARRGTKAPGPPAVAGSPLADIVPAGARLVLFAGKGGVGKTTGAATFTLAAARRAGTKWLLLSADPAHSLGDVLGRRLGPQRRPLTRTLDACEIDAPAALERWKERYRQGVEALLARLGGGREAGAQLAFDQRVMEELVELAPPGIDEILAVLSVARALGEARSREAYDTVVIDAAPTGHALRMLEMPEVALSWIKAMIAVVLKYREVTGLGDLAAELLAQSKALRHLEELMHDRKRMATVVMTRAATLPRRETARLVGELRRARIPVSAVVVNALTPPGCARCRRAAREERRQIRALRREVPAKVPLRGAPAVAPPPRGPRELSRWGETWSTIEP
jgi:arsenite-transporting ATPase